jgi:hypothetical protein
VKIYTKRKYEKTNINVTHIFWGNDSLDLLGSLNGYLRALYDFQLAFHQAVSSYVNKFSRKESNVFCERVKIFGQLACYIGVYQVEQVKPTNSSLTTNNSSPE